jgi:hypothetical protein
MSYWDSSTKWALEMAPTDACRGRDDLTVDEIGAVIVFTAGATPTVVCNCETPGAPGVSSMPIAAQVEKAKTAAPATINGEDFCWQPAMITNDEDANVTIGGVKLA